MNDIKINDLPPLLKPHTIPIKGKSLIERCMITITSKVSHLIIKGYIRFKE
jgi:hypothetical protein